MSKDIRIKVKFRGNLKEVYGDLSLGSRIRKDIDRTISKIIEGIKQGKIYGQPIKKKLIPKEYKKEGVEFVLHTKLSKERRLIYTMVSLSENETLVKILDWFKSHKEYERKLTTKEERFLRYDFFPGDHPNNPRGASKRGKACGGERGAGRVQRVGRDAAPHGGRRWSGL